jgi:hypothetical protein
VSADLVDAEAWLRAFVNGFYVTPGAKESARVVLTEYDRMRVVAETARALAYVDGSDDPHAEHNTRVGLAALRDAVAAWDGRK